MEHTSSFVNGEYFWRDHIMDLRIGMAMSIPAVIHEPFSGMLDMETGDGALFDIHGMSRILLTEHDDDLLCFEKQYMEKGGVTPRGPIISYALRKDPHTGVYIGTWERGERENEGLAIMVLNQMPIPFESYVDHTYLLEKITQLSPESEGLKRWHEEREKPRNSSDNLKKRNPADCILIGRLSVMFLMKVVLSILWEIPRAQMVRRNIHRMMETDTMMMIYHSKATHFRIHRECFILLTIE